MDGADDILDVEAPSIKGAMEQCCAACNDRDSCAAWDVWAAGDSAYLCQVRLCRLCEWLMVGIATAATDPESSRAPSGLSGHLLTASS